MASQFNQLTQAMATFHAQASTLSYVSLFAGSALSILVITANPQH
jgi:hypothetical protein